MKTELEDIWSWLGNFVKGSLVDPLDFCASNFGSVDFVFTQILGIFYAFEGNATLVAANPSVLDRIAEEFRLNVIEFAFIPAIENFIKCVGKSTYDALRTSAIEIICKCKVDASLVPINDYLPILGHPRAINNEGAARIILLHARLSNTSRFTSILDEISANFESLKRDFPASLREHNINGRLLYFVSFFKSDPKLMKLKLIGS